MITKHTFAALVLVLPLAAASAWVLPPARAYESGAQESPQRTHTDAGKITSVMPGVVAVDIKVEGKTTSMVFATNDNTKIDGKLKEGAAIRVDYYTDTQGKMIATHIVVQPSN
jgi:hypothetical protein